MISEIKCAAHGVGQLGSWSDAAILMVTSTSLRNLNFLF